MASQICRSLGDLKRAVDDLVNRHGEDTFVGLRSARGVDYVDSAGVQVELVHIDDNFRVLATSTEVESSGNPAPGKPAISVK